MEGKFVESVKSVLDGRKARTENGATMHATSGSRLLDCWYRLSSMRGMDEKEIEGLFSDAFYENEDLAVRFMFYVLDMRGGAGERRAFDAMFSWLAGARPEFAASVLKLIPFYGRWDLLVKRVWSDIVGEEALEIVRETLEKDVRAACEGRTTSLLAKWLPSVNCSSDDTRRKAKDLCRRLKIRERDYRRRLSLLRGTIGVVERRMSSGEWGEIDYSAVPSKANIVYREAFMRHDKERREGFLQDLKDGKEGVKINSSACFPYEIVRQMRPHSKDDPTLEEMWKSLPDYVDGDATTIVVHDSSGSMMSFVDKGQTVLAEDVADSLAIYFAERCRGAYKDKIITFSREPHFVDIGGCRTLSEKLLRLHRFSFVENTDICKVMRLVLAAAVKGRLEQKDIPRILIVSDMEFDIGVDSEKTVMDEIGDEFKAAGYSMPHISYWNVSNRSGGVPCREGDYGMTLVSGFSPSAVRIALAADCTPYSALCGILKADRYDYLDVLKGLGNG